FPSSALNSAVSSATSSPVGLRTITRPPVNACRTNQWYTPSALLITSVRFEVPRREYLRYDASTAGTEEDPMLFSDRSIWTMVHGIGLGGGALLGLAAALFYLYAARSHDGAAAPPCSGAS